MRDGVPADPRTIREHIQGILDHRGPLPRDVFDHAVAALAQLDACNRLGLHADTPRLVPDSGVVLDPQHNDAP